MTETSPFLPAAPDRRIAVVGAGRLGGVFARALREAGFTVIGPLRRDDPIPAVDVAILCVPDAAIRDAADATRPHAGLVGHTSGATGLDEADFSIHPLQTFTGSEEPGVFRGIGAAVDGRTPEALDTARYLADALGADPFPVDDAHRAGYHASASIASNLLLAVLDAAERAAGAAGIPSTQARAVLAPLVRQTVENWAERGAAAALTGPIVRGDEGTVARQRAAIADGAPELLAVVDALTAQTRTIARRALDGAGARSTPRGGADRSIGRRDSSTPPGVVTVTEESRA
ncbi:Rossmann-like and DUF2520 domain-containing protein [uncultured Microbacterium sp.]|uniref:Rossmann-like and DUF2520 domain-containing protein n=1 Tax=uncultured Microbacterium sp. TaxID=191216 RepID=UPI0025D76675|nr:Rossmann-like and DUF2520 domain-containing protein [uncultured Microbacterium sp.]